MKRIIYADNAATSRLSDEALAAMMPFLKTEYGNASQLYAFSRPVKQALHEARKTIASCINASPEEIYFTSGGTESDNWALKGIMFVYGDNRALITTQIEHHAVLHTAAAIERMGYPVAYLPVDSTGTVWPSSLKTLLSERTKLVSVMYSNNEVGSIQPIAELTAIAHECGSIFHTDAVQAVGHVPIDVKALDVDMLSASAHKFNGPKGIGFLYIKKGTLLNPFIDGGAQEYGMRAGTENIASIVGMANALKANCENMSNHCNHLLRLETELLSELKQTGLEFIRNGAINHVPGNISLSFKNADGEMILHRLDLMGIYISTGSACDSKKTQISHVLKAMGVPKEYALGTIRISFGYSNTIEDVHDIVKGLSRILA